MAKQQVNVSMTIGFLASAGVFFIAGYLLGGNPFQSKAHRAGAAVFSIGCASLLKDIILYCRPAPVQTITVRPEVNATKKNR